MENRNKHEINSLTDCFRNLTVENKKQGTNQSPLMTSKLEYHSQVDSEVGAFSPNSSSSPINHKSGEYEPNPQDDMQSQKLQMSSGTLKNLEANDITEQKIEEEKKTQCFSAVNPNSQNAEPAV
jgi:hypothetical protein